MLDALRIGFRSFGGNAQGNQHVYDESVAGPHASGEDLSFFGQEHPAIGTSCGQCLSFQSSNSVDGGRMRDAEAAGDVCWTCFSRGGQQISNQFDVVFEQGGRLGRPCLAEPARLRQLCRKTGNAESIRPQQPTEWNRIRTLLAS